MQIPLDRADDDGVLRLDAGGGKQGLEEFQGLLHGARGDQHFRDEDLVAFELIAHDGHAGDEALFHDGGRAVATVQQFLSESDRIGSFAGDNCRREVSE